MTGDQEKKRDKHPIKEIEKAIKYVEDLGWKVEKCKKSSHCWAQMKCPHAIGQNHCHPEKLYCQTSIWSTPKSSENHARQIRSLVNRCEKRRN